MYCFTAPHKPTLADWLPQGLHELHDHTCDAMQSQCLAANLPDHCYAQPPFNIDDADFPPLPSTPRNKHSDLFHISTTPQQQPITINQTMHTYSSKTYTNSVSQAHQSTQITDTPGTQKTQRKRPPQKNTNDHYAKKYKHDKVSINTENLQPSHALPYNNHVPIINIGEHRFRCYDVPGTGSCYFYCLSLFRTGSLHNDKFYRQLICGHIHRNWDTYEDQVKLLHPQHIHSKEAYHNIMVSGLGFATAVEIDVTVQLLRINIDTWLQCQYTQRETNQQITKFHLTQSFANLQAKKMSLRLKTSHFNLLIPVSQLQQRNALNHFHPQSPASSSHKQDTNFHENAHKSEHTLGRQTQENDAWISPKIVNKSTTEHYFEIPTQNSFSSLTVSEISQNEDTQQYHTKCKGTANNDKTPSKGTSHKKKKIRPKLHKPHTLPMNTTHASPTNAHSIHSQGHNNKKLVDEAHRRKMALKLGVKYDEAKNNETPPQRQLRFQRNARRIVQAKLRYRLQDIDALPDLPTIPGNDHYNTAMQQIRAFELTQMSYIFNTCKICHEKRLLMKMSPKDNTICHRCFSDKHQIKLFSEENFMDPGPVPEELQNLSITEQQLICRISPAINVHLLKHGGIAAKGHCVTFPQEINEPAKNFPRLPPEVNLVRVRKQGSNDTTKDFTVRRYTIQSALLWLKQNNPAYADIEIS